MGAVHVHGALGLSRHGAIDANLRMGGEAAFSGPRRRPGHHARDDFDYLSPTNTTRATKAGWTTAEDVTLLKSAVAVLTSTEHHFESSAVVCSVRGRAGSRKVNESSHQKIKSDPPSAKSAIEQTHVAAAEFVIIAHVLALEFNISSKLQIGRRERRGHGLKRATTRNCL